MKAEDWLTVRLWAAHITLDECATALAQVKRARYDGLAAARGEHSACLAEAIRWMRIARFNLRQAESIVQRTGKRGAR